MPLRRAVFLTARSAVTSARQPSLAAARTPAELKVAFSLVSAACEVFRLAGLRRLSWGPAQDRLARQAYGTGTYVAGFGIRRPPLPGRLSFGVDGIRRRFIGRRRRRPPHSP